jgi:hypothetical protein
MCRVRSELINDPIVSPASQVGSMRHLERTLYAIAFFYDIGIAWTSSSQAQIRGLHSPFGFGVLLRTRPIARLTTGVTLLVQASTPIMKFHDASDGAGWRVSAC